VLLRQLQASGITIPITVGVHTFSDLRRALCSPGWDSVKTIALEITRIEEWAVKHTLATVKNEKGATASRIEEYGYGKGYQYVYETFCLLLADLDRHVFAGRNVLLIAHDCVRTVPNPGGDDWIRYEPRLQDPASGKASIRLRVKEWADHVLWLGYDMSVDKEGKAAGQGTRTIYTAELPHFMAKSRTTAETIPIVRGQDVWGKIFK
jgi:hypothetical protein